MLFLHNTACFIRELLDLHYPTAEKIVLVLDNLNTHTPAALCEAFPPAEARPLVEKLEIDSTPGIAVGVSIAEIELAVLAEDCLSRRIDTQAQLAREPAAWQQRSNQKALPVNWRLPPGMRVSSSNISTHQLKDDSPVAAHLKWPWLSFEAFAAKILDAV